MSDKDPLSSLDEEGRSRISRMFSGCAEVVGVEHVASVISGDPSHSGDDQLVAYIGLEPSGKAHVAYIPTDRIVGISKLARIVEVYARRLQNQERITTQVADALEKHLKPLGAAVIIEASHACMGCRGVKKSHAIMSTSAMRGVFFDKAEARAELMQLIKE